MDARLFTQALTKFLSGLLAVGLLLFVPAGTFSFWQAWLLIGILFVPMFIAGLIMLAYIPIIAKRIQNEEAVLEEGLEGYTEYKQSVRYKVIPFVW